MADPLSVAGLVTSVISLGLQVAGGLSDYLKGMKGREEELSSAKRRVDTMKDLLLTIQDLLPRMKNSWPTSATSIERHVQTCNTEISALFALLTELSQPASSGSGIRLKLAEQKQKLSYPFNRTHLSHLEERLVKVNNALQTALHVTGLDVSITTSNELRQVHDSSITAKNQVQQLHDVSIITRDEVRQIRDVSITTSNQVQQMYDFSITARDELRQTCDELRVMCQSTTARAQKMVACLPLMVSENPERKVNGGIGVPLDSIEAAVSLASKPSLLSTSIESLARYNTLPTRHRNMSSACMNDATQAANVSIEYRGLTKLFQTAFVLSFSNTYGAGGRSVSPCFTYYPSVDRDTAPAFRILNLVNCMLSDSKHYDTSEVLKALQCCFDSVLTLYSRRKASPMAVDQFGGSLLHLVAQNIPLLLQPKDPTVSLLQAYGARYSNWNWWIRTTYTNILMHDITLAEAAGCGPLSLAAIAGDKTLVQDIILRHPQSLEEVDLFGNTPLHLAINQVSCLRLILEASGSSLLNVSNLEGWTPFEYASRMGYTSSYQLLLAWGSCISVWCVGNAHASCQDNILVALKQRRDELKSLALENLTETEAKSFGLHENAVLDSNALKVQELLQRRGVNIPPHLHVEEKWGVASVYQASSLTQNIESLDKLWALGFRDIGSPDEFGWVPLTRASRNFEVTRWFIEHGADYRTPIRNNNWTPAHILFNYMGRHYRLNHPLEALEGRRWLVEKLLQVRAGDACSCLCAVTSCTPFKVFLDAWSESNVWSETDVTSETDVWSEAGPSHSAERCVELIRAFQPLFNKEDLVAVIRRVTFDALELIHTCVHGWHYDHGFDHERQQPTSEEIEEINSEQSALLTLFTDLLVEFEQAAYEDEGGMPLILSDPEEFWTRRWLPRITETLAELNGDDLTQEEITAAETIGVVWGPQPVCKDDGIREVLLLEALAWDLLGCIPSRNEMQMDVTVSSRVILKPNPLAPVAKLATAARRSPLQPVYLEPQAGDLKRAMLWPVFTLSISSATSRGHAQISNAGRWLQRIAWFLTGSLPKKLARKAAIRETKKVPSHSA
ncbi:hypothetical protein CHU98_g10977 [Xylaria longipes]|nr:hypothetical protein CHU98_g10977 [Xylaria longipes]